MSHISINYVGVVHIELFASWSSARMERPTTIDQAKNKKG